ncbi:MAG: hypothetical protein J6B89_00045 [Bacilli bacterium]|nr:hypothetical protein [Bacilli bacterium]
MNNISIGIKKFLTNKNTVTIVGVVAAVLVLYIGYNWRVKQATNPISVPYAIKTIKPGLQITEDMVGETEVPPAMLKGDVIRSKESVINKYSNADSIIPEGSLFYSRSVVEKEMLPNSIILDYPKGYVLYYMDVNTTTTYGNSIYPGNYIDIYLKAINKIDDTNNSDNDKIMVGKLLENVKVLAVKDSAGNAVFSNVDDNTTPAMIIFAVPSEYFILLKKAGFLRAYDTSLIPVPTSESLKDNPGELQLSSNDLKDFINRVTMWTDGQ